MSSATSPTTTSQPARNQNGGKGANSNQKRGPQGPNKGQNGRKSRDNGRDGKSPSGQTGPQVKDYTAERERRQQVELAKHVDEANRELTDITLAAILALFVSGYPVSEEVLTVSASDAGIAAELGVIRNAKEAYRLHGRKVTVKPGSYTANKITTSEPALAETTTENALGLRLTAVGDALARRYIEAMTAKNWRWPAPGRSGPRVSMAGAVKVSPRKPAASVAKSQQPRPEPQVNAPTAA